MDFRVQQGSKGWFVVADYVILFFAVIANCFALHSVYRSQFGLRAYRRFLLSLVASDLFVCFINLLNFINQSLADHFNGGDSLQPCVTNFLRSLLIFGVFANLYNLCGMSVDHYIGIIYPMRYSYITNNGLARCAVLVVWLLAFCCGFADVPVVSILYLFAGTPSEPSSVPSNIIDHRKNCSLPQKNQNWSSLLSFAGGLFPGAVEKTFQSRRPKAGKLRPRTNIFLWDLSKPGRNGNPNYAALPELDSVDLMELTRIIQDNIGSINQSLFQDSHLCEDEGQAAKESQFMRELNDFQSISTYDHEATNNWCLFSNSNKIWLELFVVFCTVVCFIFVVICYGKIFRTVALKIRERSIRKLVITTCLLLGNFALCWCPLMFFEITMWAIVSHEPNYQNGPHPDSLLTAHNVFNTIFLSHPLFDPVVYVARLPNVQRYVIRNYSWLWCRQAFSEKDKDLRQKASRMHLSCGSRYSVPLTRTTTRNNSTISDLNDENSDNFNESPVNYGVTLKYVKQCNINSSANSAAHNYRRIIASSKALERVSSNVLEYLREESAYNRGEQAINCEIKNATAV